MGDAMSAKIDKLKPKTPKQDRNTCPGCRKAVEKLFSVPVGRKLTLWHPPCLLCTNCKSPLLGAQYFLQKNAQSSPYCLRCNSQMFSKKCAGCCKPLAKFGCLAMDVCWHRNCFKCQLCYNPISKLYYLLEKNRPICYECHKKPPDCYADMVRSAAAASHGGEIMTPLSRKPSGPLTLAIFTDPRFPIAEESTGTIQSPSNLAKPENAEIPMEILPQLSLDDFGLSADQESQSTTKGSKKILSHIQTSSKLMIKDTSMSMKCATGKEPGRLKFEGIDVINDSCSGESRPNREKHITK